MPSTIRPLLLKGHSRPLTHVVFNREGDLLITCAKDQKPNIWWSDNGERIGTYEGHEGVVWQCDFSFNSSRILTGSGDKRVILWETQTGKKLDEWTHNSQVRTVQFAIGDRMFVAATDSSFSQTPTIYIYNLSESGRKVSDEPVQIMTTTDTKVGKYVGALWGPLNQTIITASDDGYIRIWNVETGEVIRKIQAHKRQINNIQYSKDRTMIITASSDQTAKLWGIKVNSDSVTDARDIDLELKRTFTSDRPLNAAAISPSHPYIIVGGGQEAMNVTTTRAQAGKFETDFYHIVYTEFLGAVKGHFGPINTLAFNPTGKSFVSGAEDGYCRLHHFDKEYLTHKT